MLPSLDDASVLDHFQLPDHSQHFQNPWSPWNTPEILGQEYEVGTVHKLKPMSKPLLALVEWCSALFTMTTIIT